MSAIFGGINTPYVDKLTLKRVMSPKVKENIFQGIIFRPGEAVTEQYSTDTDSAEIQVIRIKPDGVEARRIGSGVNGGYFNGEGASQSATAAVGIRILDTYDACKDIPTNAQDMINVDIAEGELKNLTGKINKNINSATLAAQIAKALNNAYTNSDNTHILKAPSTYTKGDYKDLIIDAGAVLDNGNETEGIDCYPIEERAIIIRSTMKAKLIKDGELIIGGSNAAQGMLRNGGLDPDTKPNIINGYCGTIGDMPVYVASNAIWNKAEDYLGVARNALANVLGVVVSQYGTGRALAFNSAIKTIDSPAGQGIRIQPKYRWGVECWDALSVVVLALNAFSNFSTGDLEPIPPASRERTFTVTYAAGGGTGTAPTAVTALGGQFITLAAVGGLTKTGYTFIGWTCDLDDKVYSAGTTYQLPMGNVTFTAKWKKD